MMLLAFAVPFGILAAAAFRRYTNASKLRATVNQILARIMELTLFVDEPRTVLRAQWALLRENVHLLRHVALPSLIVAAAFALIYPKLETRYNDPNPGILTLPFGSALPANVVAETPPVRVIRTHELSWRIQPRPTRPHWLLWFLTISTVSGLTPAFVRRGK